MPITKASGPRRIVYVLRTFPEVSETFVVREIEGLRRAGVPVTVLAAWRAAGRTPEGLDVRWLTGPGAPAGPVPSPAPVWRDRAALGLHPRRWARAFRLARLASRAASVLPGDTWRLHAHFANDAAALARYLSAAVRVPYRLTAHAYDLYRDPFLLDANLRAADRVYTVSRVNLEFLNGRARERGWDPGRARLLRCGIDLERFAYRDPPPVGRPARLLCVARLVPKKGHAGLLEALRTATENGLDARLDLVGEGPLDRALRERVRELGLGDRVAFLGALPEDEVRRRMRGADLVVLASRIAADGDRDGLPVVLVESLALGAPALSTTVAGIPELLDEASGWTVEPDRPDRLARALHDALESGEATRRERAREGRRRVEREFDVRLQVEELRPPGDGLPCPLTKETTPC